MLGRCAQDASHQYITPRTCAYYGMEGAGKDDVRNSLRVDVLTRVCRRQVGIHQRRLGDVKAFRGTIWLDKGFAMIVRVDNEDRTPTPMRKTCIGERIKAGVIGMVRPRAS